MLTLRNVRQPDILYSSLFRFFKYWFLPIKLISLPEFNWVWHTLLCFILLDRVFHFCSQPLLFPQLWGENTGCFSKIPSGEGEGLGEWDKASQETLPLVDWSYLVFDVAEEDVWRMFKITTKKAMQNSACKIVISVWASVARRPGFIF